MIILTTVIQKQLRARASYLQSTSIKYEINNSAMIMRTTKQKQHKARCVHNSRNNGEYLHDN